MNGQSELVKLATKLRTMSIFYHQAHHVSARVSFFGDHEALQSFYEAAIDGYDSVAERIVGTFGADALNLQTIMKTVMDNIMLLPSNAQENKILFQSAQKLEEEMQSIGEGVVKLPIPEGTKQLVGDLLDKSLTRIYKIKRRTL